MMASSILSVSCQLKNVPLITEIDKMNNEKLSSSFETLNCENDNDGTNSSRSVSPDITKFEEPGMFILIDEKILEKRKGRQLRSSIRDIDPKAIGLSNVGIVILHQEDPKMKAEELNGEMKVLSMNETRETKRTYSSFSETKVKDVDGNTKMKSHFSSPFHVTRIQEGKLQAFKEILGVSSIMIFLTENEMVEINSWRHFLIKKKRGRPKKRNGSNNKLLPTKNGDDDSDSVYKRRTRNSQPSKLGDHKKAGEYSESKIALISNRRVLRSREVHM